MAHELAIVSGKASIAYVGEKPWHGLGQELTPNSPISVWKEEAGMNWEIKSSPVTFATPGSETDRYTGKRVLYRGDTCEPLAVVSDEYNIVQPGEVLDFFQDLVTHQGMKLHTAGALFGGRRFWALADTGRAFDVNGSDRINGMLLLTTSCDGTLATTAQFTSVRVVCNNTLAFSLSGSDSSHTRTKVSHRSEFDPSAMKSRLGVLDESWEAFKRNITDMSKQRISERGAREFIFDLLYKPDRDADNQPRTVEKDVEEILARYRNGMGTSKTEGTVWGVLNSITEHVDHTTRARKADQALWNTWYGKGAAIKTQAYERALML